MTDPKRPRKKGEARRQIVEAARDLFARRGYDGTSFRDIALQAQVNEALIYRSIGSKEQLFREAVIDPYHAFVSEFVEKWKQERKPLSNQQMMDRFVTDIYSMLRQHRELILALVAAKAFGESAADAGSDSLLSLELDRLVAQTSKEVSFRGFDRPSLGIGIRCVVGIMMSFALLDDWLLPAKSKRMAEKSMLKQISRFAVAAMEGVGGADKSRK